MASQLQIIGCGESRRRPLSTFNVYVHDAYGALSGRIDTVTYPSVPMDLDPVGFGGQAGYYTDQETGLCLLGARYYDAGTGRFLNRDPTGYDGGINLYGFCQNNPVMESDPEGTTDHDSLLHNLAVNAENAVDGVGELGLSVGSLGLAVGDTAIAGGDLAIAGGDLAIVAEEGTVGLAKATARAALNAAAKAIVTLSHREVRRSLSALGTGHDIQSHHIIQHAAVKHLPGYSREDAPAIPLQGPAQYSSTDHGITRFVQRQSGGGTFLSEVKIAYKTLRRAGLDVDEARGHVQNAISYFKSLGANASTPTLIPLDRH